ncbi:TadE/TadG family type IV pilus assembly protein [Streptomyces alkaliterrae]|uniref:Pilus assembly protein n=1 Tax=Streptomyces alkaliterrae TaxID=2213162 RepID=A0A5P0YJY4_9ACTN|nr:TadE/TadG family type IV pilus assembly protein [Streptomyces alkaliterrae]MBB1258334.1 pilus assembly protein [Streptomyces alkaliterrae]MQS00684.1 pilus assembly protein [Streptomyces alkaliterrae]
MRQITGLLRGLRQGGGDRGSAAVEAAIVIPGVIALISLAWAAGRIGIAQSKVDAAAIDAARAASIHRTAAAGQPAAAAAAQGALRDQGLRCSATSVRVDASGLGAPVGEVGTVTVTVSCTVPLADLTIPSPGAKTMTSTFTSVVDAYRQR